MSSLLTPGGKIKPRSITGTIKAIDTVGLSATQQRLLSKSIKRARVMGIIPYTSSITLTKGY